MTFLKKIRIKFALKAKLVKLISSVPIIHKYSLRNKSTTLKKWCTEIESFPTDEEMISKDWYLSIRSPEKTQIKLPITLDGIELKKLQKYYLNTTHYQEIPEVFLSCINKAKILSKKNFVRWFFPSVF